MDILKKEDGVTIIESLVGILILGLIVTFSIAIFVKLFSNPSMWHRHEAYLLANQEITSCLNSRAITDTLYRNDGNYLELRRTIRNERRIFNINVTVSTAKEKREIVTLLATYVK